MIQKNRKNDRKYGYLNKGIFLIGMSLMLCMQTRISAEQRGSSIYGDSKNKLKVDGISAASQSEPAADNAEYGSPVQTPQEEMNYGEGKAWLCLPCGEVRVEKACPVCGQAEPGADGLDVDYIYTSKGDHPKFGYMDREGRIVLDLVYDYAAPFSAGMGRVFSGTMGEHEIPDTGLYGYVDATGRLVLPLLFEKAEDFTESGLAVVCLNGKYGVINQRAEVVIGFFYDYITHLPKTNTFKAFRGKMGTYSPEEGVYTILREDGSAVFTGPYSNVRDAEGYYIVTDRSHKEAIFSLEGEPITEFCFEDLYDKGEAMAGFKENDHYGYIDLKAQEVIPAVCDEIGRFYGDSAIVEKNGIYYRIDRAGDILVQYEADYVDDEIGNGITYAFKGTLNAYGSPEDGLFYLIDLDGNELSRGFEAESRYAVVNAHWRIKEGNLWHVLDADGKEVFCVRDAERLIDCEDGCYVSEWEGKCTLLDAHGLRLSEQSFGDINPTDSELKPVQSLRVE